MQYWRITLVLHWASLLRSIFASSVRANQRVHVHNKRNFPQAKLDSEINVRFLLNEHGNLYFLLHNDSVSIILLDLKKNKKNLSEGKKTWVKECTKPLLCDVNYDRENIDSTNALRPRRFKYHGFSTNFICYCSICSTLSTRRVFSQVLFCKLCFELPQNVTWTMNNARD